MTGLFDIGRFAADVYAVTLALSGHAVLVGEMDLGAGGLHHLVDGSTGTSYQVRMVRVEHFHAQRRSHVLPMSINMMSQQMRAEQ